MKRPIRTAILDAQQIFRLGITTLLASLQVAIIVAEGSDFEPLLRYSAGELLDVLIVGFDDARQGMNRLVELKGIFKKAKIVVLSGHPESCEFRALIAAGAVGYASRSITCTELLDLLKTTMKGGIYVEPKLVGKFSVGGLKKPSDLKKFAQELTARERIILEAISKAQTNKEIAHCLSIAERTVKGHVTHIFAKLGVRNRIEAAKIWNKIFA